MTEPTADKQSELIDKALSLPSRDDLHTLVKLPGDNATHIANLETAYTNARMVISGLIDALQSARPPSEQRRATSQELGIHDDRWQSVAMQLGEKLCATGPRDYYTMTPLEWYEWARPQLEARLSATAPLVDRGEAVNLVHDLRAYGDNALHKITNYGLRCLFDAVERMDKALSARRKEGKHDLHQRGRKSLACR